MANTDYIIMRSREFIFEDETLDISDLPDDQKSKLKRIVKRAKEQPELLEELFNTISLKFQDDDGGLKSRILDALEPDKTDPEKDYENFKEAFAKVIENVNGATEDKIKFVKTLGQKDYIDHNKLMSPQKVEWRSWLPDSQFIKNIFLEMFNNGEFTNKNKGPGEVALAVLSPNITLSTSQGDINIFGTPVEVKAIASSKSSGGNMKPTDPKALQNVYGDRRFWEEILSQEDQQPDSSGKSRMETLMYQTVQYKHFNEYVRKNNLSDEEIKAILKETFRASGIESDIEQVAKKGQNISGEDVAKLGIKNYAYSHGDYHFLIMNKGTETSIYFDLENLDEAIGDLQIDGYIISNEQRGNPVKIGVR